jgi:hypothetical protein
MKLTTNKLTAIVLDTGGRAEVIRQFGPLFWPTALAHSPNCYQAKQHATPAKAVLRAIRKLGVIR